MRGKLTTGQRVEIIRGYLDGEYVTTLAKRYGVSDSYPSMLARRLGYRLRGRLGRDPARVHRGWARAVNA